MCMTVTPPVTSSSSSTFLVLRAVLRVVLRRSSGPIRAVHNFYLLHVFFTLRRALARAIRMREIIHLDPISLVHIRISLI